MNKRSVNGINNSRSGQRKPSLFRKDIPPDQPRAMYGPAYLAMFFDNKRGKPVRLKELPGETTDRPTADNNYFFIHLSSILILKALSDFIKVIQGFFMV